MTRIYLDEYPHGSINHLHALPFEIEKQLWQPVIDIAQAEVIPMIAIQNIQDIIRQWQYIKPKYSNQPILLLSLYHASEGTDSNEAHERLLNMWHQFTENVIIVHSNKDNLLGIYYDMMWNRQKAYYVDNDRLNLYNRLWTHLSTNKMFELALPNKREPMKKFISPSRIYYQDTSNARIQYRQKLLSILEDQDGYCSNFALNRPIWPQEKTVPLLDYLSSGRGGEWMPCDNYYYKTSFFSFYVETIVWSNTMRLVTEKTFDPLIKCHYIVPFGYSGLIRDIQNYGFKLPTWIDYSYDDIVDNDIRWEAYAKELIRLLAIPYEELFDRWVSDFTMVEANRKIFWQRPYDTLHDKVAALIANK